MVNNLQDSGYQEFIRQLSNLIAARIHTPEADLIADFANNYYANTQLSELLDKSLDDTYGEVVSTWHFIQNLDRKNTKIRIFNPTVENDGWQTTHTVLEILTLDMPFIVDSVRMALNNHAIAIHSIINTVFTVERSGTGQVLSAVPHDTHAHQGGIQEAILHIEIVRQSNESKLALLRHEILSILAELKVGVADFPNMLTQLEQVKESLKQKADCIDNNTVPSVIELLTWLSEENFTFLGYRNYALTNEEKRISPMKEFDLGIIKVNTQVDLLDDIDVYSAMQDQTLVFAKSSTLSRIHRPTYPEIIIINDYDKTGQRIGEHRFLGLFTAKAFQEDPARIPLIGEKLAQIIEQTGLDKTSHDYKQLKRIISTLPREDLFRVNTEELFKTITGILHIKERPRLKLFVHSDPFKRFVSCIIYAPRDCYSTEMRIKFQTILCKVFESNEINFSTQFSESILVQVHIVLKVSPDKPIDVNTADIERRLADVYRTWEDDLQLALNEVLGEEEAAAANAIYLHAFPASYKEDFLPRMAVADIRHMATMNETAPMDLSFYRAVEDASGLFRFKLFHLEKIIPLSDVIPVLENLGLKILGERPYEVRRKNNSAIWIHDFSVRSYIDEEINIDHIKNCFQAAFRQAWKGAIENDGFNRLVIGAQLSWQEVMLLRGYAKYLKQINFPFSQSYIETALGNYHFITHQLITLFKIRFDPDKEKNRNANEETCLTLLYAELDKVENLDEDKILRRFVEAIMATVRTNYFQWYKNSPEMPYLSLKFDPAKITDIPLPRPMYEIFVYSARVEAVHLRAGKVARGGLRWSDRKEDFRTEVLGLVKAQQVKNSVIVPVGAKGGFVCKMLPVTEDRELINKEVIASYQLFVSALLEITDNLKEGIVVPPDNVVRKDGDDPYLVVAADKGTASFSDIANRISLQKGFWLGDAFASGGSAGYDHKKMAITARGAWVSVQSHFRELDFNIQKHPFTVIGIGDMSGDVFGNGLLMSKKIKLVAAFNHMDIFIDPTPNAEKSFVERQRLFDLPRSTWQNYNKELISKGGGVFSRKAKSIAISPEMQKCFSIQEEKLTPNALISALLKAPVDLIWNGGIGTYIKATREQHFDVGDKTNDAVRVNGSEVNCRVFSEGGNLGITQLGRIEMAMKGIALNADFIDNSAGVDCSDHEVNLKILLNHIVANGDMTPKQRNELLVEMTEEVADLVLHDNYRQVQAISFNESLSAGRLDELKRYIHYLEGLGKLNRVLEFLPGDDEMNERKKSGRGLTRPELAILLSYSKNLLKEQLLECHLLDDPCVAVRLETAFPRVITSKFKKQLYNHQLREEIIATQVANSIVNDMGFTFVLRMHDASGAESADIVKAYIISRSIYQLDELWNEIQALDYKVSAQTQLKMMTDISRVIRRATRWFLRNRRGTLDVQQVIDHFQPKINEISANLLHFIRGELKENYENSMQDLLQQGVPDALASKVASIAAMPSFLGMIEASDITHKPLHDVATLYFMLGDELHLHWFRTQIHTLQISNHWQALARETYRDDLDWQQRALTVSVLQTEMQSNLSLQERLQVWKKCYKSLLNRWAVMLNELKAGNVQEFSMYTVALRELLDIAQYSVHSCLNIQLDSDEKDSR